METTHGNKVSFLRKKNEMSQSELAKKMKIDRACLSLIENDKRKLNLDECISLCEHFNISLDEFIGKNKSPWIDINSDTRPVDDSTVFVRNINISRIPIKAYYQEVTDEFICLENIGTTLGISVTHFMYIPD